MKKRSLVIGLLVMVLTVTLVGKATADGVFMWYDLTVPALGGSAVTTNMTKRSTDKSVICSQEVALNYTLKARIELLDNSVAAGYQTINDNQRREYTLSPSTIGSKYHARLKTLITTLVGVEAIGTFSPDNPAGCGF